MPQASEFFNMVRGDVNTSQKTLTILNVDCVNGSWGMGIGKIGFNYFRVITHERVLVITLRFLSCVLRYCCYP